MTIEGKAAPVQQLLEVQPRSGAKLCGIFAAEQSHRYSKAKPVVPPFSRLAFPAPALDGAFSQAYLQQVNEMLAQEVDRVIDEEEADAATKTELLVAQGQWLFKQETARFKDAVQIPEFIRQRVITEIAACASNKKQTLSLSPVSIHFQLIENKLGSQSARSCRNKSMKGLVETVTNSCNKHLPGLLMEIPNETFKSVGHIVSLRLESVGLTELPGWVCLNNFPNLKFIHLPGNNFVDQNGLCAQIQARFESNQIKVSFELKPVSV